MRNTALVTAVCIEIVVRMLGLTLLHMGIIMGIVDLLSLVTPNGWQILGTLLLAIYIDVLILWTLARQPLLVPGHDQAIALIREWVQRRKPQRDCE